MRCSQVECSHYRCTSCDRNIDTHTCSSCEHRDVQASFRCESCNRPSEDLVKACVNLRGDGSGRLYPHHINYVERCENCAAENPKWVTPLGYCNACEPTTPRVGVICPACANRHQHYCSNCSKPVEEHMENMLCVGCSMEVTYAPVKHSANHHRICRDCSRTGPVNSAGICKDCFREERVRGFYLTRPYYTKCKTCDEPATTDKGYCKQCSKSLINCVKCSTPVIRPKMTCGHHDYKCCACGNQFSPKDMTDITCDYCVTYGKREKRCAKCDVNLDVEASYLSSGICDNCYEKTVHELRCRRCGVTKGYDICPDCFSKKYPCMMCEKNIVHSTQFVCTECNNKRDEQR